MVPHRLGKILENFLTGAGMQQRIREQKIIDAWERMVGKAISEMTQPVRMRNGVLQVKVANSVWMNELQFHKKIIIQKLNGYIGNATVEDLWFMIGEREKGREAIDGGEVQEKAVRHARALSQEEKERIERGISHLRDPEMKEIFFRLFSKGLALGKGDPYGIAKISKYKSGK